MKTRLFLLFLCALLLVSACGGETAVSPTDFTAPQSNQVAPHEDDGHEHVDPAQATGEMEVVLVPSELVVGQNRFAVGLFDADGQMVHEAAVHFHYFDLSDLENPVLEMEVNAVRIQDPEQRTTIFAHEREFSHAGNWGVEVQAVFPDGSMDIKRISAGVVADSVSITPGEKAPAVVTPTLDDVGSDLSLLTSSWEPNAAFYEMTLREALANGKPTLFLLATPAFCQTRFCGPAYEIANDLYDSYSNQLNFVNVEVFIGLPNPADTEWEQAPVMSAFGLNTEPWLYLIDETGTVTYRVEGMFTAGEVATHIEALLDS
ncbi:MAG: hypothetical protein ACE5FD_00485 [Anaerolineae bacterium]